MHRLFKHSLKLLSALVILLTFLSYLAPFINPVLFRWLTFFGTAFPWFLLANTILLLIWASRMHRFALYHLGILFFGWQHVSNFIGFNLGNDPAPKKAITIGTHNLGGLFRGVHYEDAEWERIYDTYTRLLQENGSPDILCTQETGRNFFRSLGPRMGYTYSYDLNRGGTAILSRFPVLRGGKVPFGQPENSSIWADIQIGKRTVRIYNVHLQSNKVTYDTKRMMDEPNLKDEKTWRGINKVLRKVGGATSIRAGQAVKLRDLIAASPHPVILCGDFNDTPNSFVYQTLSEPMTDTFREKGIGIGTTFAGSVPLLRIDYILTDPAIRPYSCRIVKSTISDHYSVLAEVSF
ncbi:MAG: hypothetical protein EP344_01155 [Bacteroidetes bacterium]|nr:MAG: hypothetical protein EP344_01155 [Bacteroidota bacterium]